MTRLLGVEHPIALGGMAGHSGPELVAAVSEAGGLGVLGATPLGPDAVAGVAADIRNRTGRPFGLNVLVFRASPELVGAVLEAAPAVLSTAWAPPEFDLSALFTAAHERGLLAMHMVSTLPEARAAEAAGADLIVAQGTEGGGHVGTMGSAVLLRQVAREAQVPVLGAGGFADGAGLAAALALGAEGVLLGTRFLATVESPLPDSFKQVIVESDGHATLLTEIPDLASNNVWPGAYARVTRNRLVEDWVGRENELRRHRVEVQARIEAARRAGDTDHAVLYAGQSAGLIDSVRPAKEVVETLVAEAASVIGELATRLRAQEPPA
jgi:NAD(P)H-dependent flavin oxidoreductase YrpB (nitropropane dioxygenase family)